MTLHDTIQADADSVFCNADDFAEPVTYYPRAGEARTINAVVLREQLQYCQRMAILSCLCLKSTLPTTRKLGLQATS